MSGTVIAFVVVALAIGALVGWLFGSRAGAGATHTVESLRLQLDEVVKERDANRDAATRLAALEASQVEREKGFEARIKELIEAKEALSVQFAEISNKLLAEAQETLPQARRPAFPAIRRKQRPEPEGAASARP